MRLTVLPCYIRLFEYDFLRKVWACALTQALREFKAGIFQALAHPTRIAIVDALRGGELTAGQIIDQAGVEQANASQHLAVLRSKQVVTNRKSGNQVYYSLRDPVILELLDVLRRYFNIHRSETLSLLNNMEVEEVRGKP